MLDRFIDFKKIRAGDPAILLGFLPGCAVLAHADNNIKPVVAKIEALTMTLRAVANECKGVVLEVVKELIARPVGSFLRKESTLYKHSGERRGWRLPYTFSSTPAKSIVLTPRACCVAPTAAVRLVAGIIGRALASAETNVRHCLVGAANCWAEELRRALLKLREAIATYQWT